MMESFLEVLGKVPDLPPFTADLEAVNWYYSPLPFSIIFRFHFYVFHFISIYFILFYLLIY